jgi:hypothetical protein
LFARHTERDSVFKALIYAAAPGGARFYFVFVD